MYGVLAAVLLVCCDPIRRYQATRLERRRLPLTAGDWVAVAPGTMGLTEASVIALTAAACALLPSPRCAPGYGRPGGPFAAHLR
jgi:hypothetical protein